MALAVEAEIGARRRIVRAVALRTIGGVRAALVRHHGNFRAVSVAVVVVIVGSVVAGSAVIIGVGIRRDRAADQGACCNRARSEAPAMVTAAPATTIIS